MFVGKVRNIDAEKRCFRASIESDHYVRLTRHYCRDLRGAAAFSPSRTHLAGLLTIYPLKPMILERSEYIYIAKPRTRRSFD